MMKILGLWRKKPPPLSKSPPLCQNSLPHRCVLKWRFSDPKVMPVRYTQSSRTNLRFTVENVVETMVIQVLCVWIRRFPLIHLTFSTVFSTVNRRFLLEDLLLSKKSVYMKNAEERAGFKIFWRKLWKWSLPCQNRQKRPQNDAIYLLCGFLRNWPTKNGASIGIFKRASLKSTYLREFFDLGSQIFVDWPDRV